MKNAKIQLLDSLLQAKRRCRQNRQPFFTNQHKCDQQSLEKGTEFESFVARRFDETYFTLLEWRSDKSIGGVYPAMNKFPDLEFYYESDNENKHFAIECKWRDNFQNEGITLKDHQLENYRRYEQITGFPTFLIIGVGHQPRRPNQVYILPLKDISKSFLHEFELQYYKRPDPQNNFFINCSLNKLL